MFFLFSFMILAPSAMGKGSLGKFLLPLLCATFLEKTFFCGRKGCPRCHRSLNSPIPRWESIYDMAFIPSMWNMIQMTDAFRHPASNKIGTYHSDNVVTFCATNRVRWQTGVDKLYAALSGLQSALPAKERPPFRVPRDAERRSFLDQDSS